MTLAVMEILISKIPATFELTLVHLYWNLINTLIVASIVTPVL